MLEQEGFGIGAVTGVQAITWLELTFTGQPNHGGTTPMKYRKDAGLAAARVNLFAHEVTQRIEGQLANMGVIRVEPGNVNVVPETVICTLDLRNPDDALLAEARPKSALCDGNGAKVGCGCHHSRSRALPLAALR